MNQIPQQPQNQLQKRSLPLSKSAKGLAPICRDALTRHWKGRPPRRVWQLMRLIVFERDGWVCVYCVTPVKGHHLSGEQSPASSGKGGMLNVLPATERPAGTRV
jgi:hypothetical protein